MCRGVVLCIVGLLISSCLASAQEQYGFRVSFTDKDATTHSLSNPSTYLSQRAIDRRKDLNIAIDSMDLPVLPGYIDSVLTLTGGKFHMTSKWLNYMVVLLGDSADILTLQNKPYIKNIEFIAYYPGGLHKPARETETTETTGGYNLPLKTTGTALYYGDAYNQTELVSGDYLHDIGWKGQGKLIAVLDEGFADVNTAPAFDSMYNSGRLVDQYNYADANTNVFSHGQHGTTSLSTMAGNLPGTYVGAAPLANYALYITEIQGSEQVLEMDNAMAASERADSIGADIITISLGYDYFTPSYLALKYSDIDGKTTIAAQAANIATSKGILFVASAGNEGGGGWNYILTPGDADSAMTVGSVSLDKQPASSSGYGPNSAGHIKPNVCMLGQPASVMRNGPVPTFSGGTSWATPQLAGWAACLMQASGKFTPYEIRTAIQKSANMYNNPGVQLGYGVPNFQYALQLLNVQQLPKRPDETDWLTVGPNPFEHQLTLRMYRTRKGQAEIILTDVAGRVVFHTTEQTAPGVQKIDIAIPELSRGVYFLKATVGDDHVTKRIVRN